MPRFTESALHSARTLIPFAISEWAVPVFISRFERAALPEPGDDPEEEPDDDPEEELDDESVGMTPSAFQTRAARPPRSAARRDGSKNDHEDDEDGDDNADDESCVRVFPRRWHTTARSAGGHRRLHLGQGTGAPQAPGPV